MSALTRQAAAQTRLRERVHPRQTVEAGPRRTASRAEIRSLLAHGPTPERSTVEQFEMSESGILVREAALLWWGTQSPPAAVDDEQYPGD